MEQSHGHYSIMCKQTSNASTTRTSPRHAQPAFTSILNETNTLEQRTLLVFFYNSGHVFFEITLILPILPVCRNHVVHPNHQHTNLVDLLHLVVIFSARFQKRLRRAVCTARLQNGVPCEKNSPVDERHPAFIHCA